MVGLLSLFLATNQLAAKSNVVQRAVGAALQRPDINDPVERELQKIMDQDDAAQAEADEMIVENRQFAAKGAGLSSATLRARLAQRLDKVKATYEDFLKKHPDHARGRLAYGSFLNDIQESEQAKMQWEKARELDPANPAAWNNLANYYGHNSPVSKSFEYYAKAIELNPKESVYYQNLASTVYLFRHDATNYYKINEQEVFDKALQLFRKALELDPGNFLLATDFAQTYYGIRPAKTGDEEADRARGARLTREALDAWRVALSLARDDIEQQGVYIHFARLQINAGQFEEARKNLGSVTNAMFTATKQDLARKLERKEIQARDSQPIVIDKDK